MLRRLFRQKDEETVGNPIEEGDSNGGRGRIGVFGMENQRIPIEILKNTQLFRFDRCEVVEGFSIRLWHVHIEVVVGNDTDRITGNV